MTHHRVVRGLPFHVDDILPEIAGGPRTAVRRAHLVRDRQPQNDHGAAATPPPRRSSSSPPLNPCCRRRRCRPCPCPPCCPCSSGSSPSRCRTTCRCRRRRCRPCPCHTRRPLAVVHALDLSLVVLATLVLLSLLLALAPLAALVLLALVIAMSNCLSFISSLSPSLSSSSSSLPPPLAVRGIGYRRPGLHEVILHLLGLLRSERDEQASAYERQDERSAQGRGESAQMIDLEQTRTKVRGGLQSYLSWLPTHPTQSA